MIPLQWHEARKSALEMVENQRFPRTEMSPETRGRGREALQSFRSRPRGIATPGNARKRAQRALGGAPERSRNGFEPTRVCDEANGSPAGDYSS